MRRPKIQKRLGYSLDTKLLIIHADDVGLCHGANAATFKCFENGCVTSASVMATCAWFYESVRYFKAHPHLDVGLHLTITCEWDSYKWGPLLPTSNVASLVDNEGFFWGHDFHSKVEASDVEKEVRAQIERSLALGFVPSHLDCHMNCLCLREDLFEIYVRMGAEYCIPIMVNKEYCTYFNIDVDKHLDATYPLVDKIYMARPENTPSGIADYYRNVLSNMQPGLNLLLIHPGQDDAEMNAISRSIYPWGAAWRAQDRDFFSSDECRDIIAAQKLVLISWRELHQRLNLFNALEVTQN